MEGCTSGPEDTKAGPLHLRRREQMRLRAHLAKTLFSGRYGARTLSLTLDLVGVRCCMLTGDPRAVCIPIQGRISYIY
jgi:hypothetical protein